MKTYIIDGSKFSTYEGAYKEIRNVLSNNTEKELLTINDLVKKYLSKNEEYNVVWEYSEKSKEDLSYPETIKFLKRRLQTVALYEVVMTLKELKEAESNTGETMFDKIVQQFLSNNIKINFQ